MPGRKFTASLLVFSLILPQIFVLSIPRAQAVIPVNDTLHIAVTTAEALRKTGKDTADGIAMGLAKLAVTMIVASTVEWANNGFDGNPAYVTNPKQYFTNLADGIAGEFIQGSDLGFLCSPFQLNVRLSLTSQYYRPDPFQCTLTEVTENIDNFYKDFSQGGWDAWFSMTQNPTNNPQGAYLEAKIELDSRLAEELGIQKEQLSWNSGFLSWADCLERDSAGQCTKSGPTKTPGSIIKSQIDNVLPSGLEQLISAEHVEQLLLAFASGLLQRYVFGPKGLFNRDTSYSPTETTLPGANECPGPALPPRSGSAPNQIGIVQAVANEFPELLAQSCLTTGGSWEFMDKVVERLHAADPGFGYNGKRGNANDLSQDAISYYAGGGSPGDGERDVHVIDIIGGHCGANPQPAWQDVTNATISCGVTGAYVYPRGGRGAGIPSTPPPDNGETLQ